MCIINCVQAAFFQKQLNSFILYILYIYIKKRNKTPKKNICYEIFIVFVSIQKRIKICNLICLNTLKEQNW